MTIINRYASIDGEYRYFLERWWDRPRGEGYPNDYPNDFGVDWMTFIMLNPSTADGMEDDPTIRRCISFAKREGATRLEVINLFALRATDPSELLTHPDPVGPSNDALLRNASVLRGRARAVVAWGAHKMVTPERVALVVNAARERGTTLWCLGTTKSGAPRHPLFVRADQPLIPWEG